MIFVPLLQFSQKKRVMAEMAAGCQSKILQIDIDGNIPL
jgi:hypothetical protein